MPHRILIKALKRTEFLAYILAGLSFAVLFLEPIISYYTSYAWVENLTAIANVLVLGLAIISRVLDTKEAGKKIIYADLVM